MPAADRAPRGTQGQASRRDPLGVPGALTGSLLLGLLAVSFAAFIKGTIAFGFPLVATPLLAVLSDVPTAVALLIVPNLVMDGIQLVRRGDWVATARRHAVLLLFGTAGTVLGTRLLVALPAEVARLVLGAVVVGFVTLHGTGLRPRVPLDWEPWLAPVAGLGAGIMGGLTNVPGTLLVLFFLALGMQKDELVRSIALTFFVYKLVQLPIAAYYGLLTVRLLAWSVGLTAFALAGFWVGLRVQDRLHQAAFNRFVLVALAILGAWLVLRAVL